MPSHKEPGLCTSRNTRICKIDSQTKWVLCCACEVSVKNAKDGETHFLGRSLDIEVDSKALGSESPFNVGPIVWDRGRNVLSLCLRAAHAAGMEIWKWSTVKIISCCLYGWYEAEPINPWRSKRSCEGEVEERENSLCDTEERSNENQLDRICTFY